MSLTLPAKQSVFVNLRDVSKRGACVLRQGTLDIHKDDDVIFEARDYDSGATIKLRCKVRWVRPTGFSTYLGLSFISSSLSEESLTRLVS